MAPFLSAFFMHRSGYQNKKGHSDTFLGGKKKKKLMLILLVACGMTPVARADFTDMMGDDTSADISQVRPNPRPDPYPGPGRRADQVVRIHRVLIHVQSASYVSKSGYPDPGGYRTEYISCSSCGYRYTEYGTTSCGLQQIRLYRQNTHGCLYLGIDSGSEWRSHEVDRGCSADF